MVSVIASSIRKGNVVEKDGKLYVVIRAENIHPGKGTPVTHLEMRRISDGVATVERYSDDFDLGLGKGLSMTRQQQLFPTMTKYHRSSWSPILSEGTDVA